MVYKADASGNLDLNTAQSIVDYDQDLLDTTCFEAETGAKYYVLITGFMKGGVFQGGNYALKIDRTPLNPNGVDIDDTARSPNNASTNDSHEDDDTPAFAKVKGNAWGQTKGCNLVAHPIGSNNVDLDWFYVEYP